MKYAPRSDWIIIQLDAVERTTRSGILLPESAQEDKCQGTVWNMGPGRTNDKGVQIPIDNLKVDDRVIVNKFSGRELDEKNRLFLFKESDISCVIS